MRTSTNHSKPRYLQKSAKQTVHAQSATGFLPYLKATRSLAGKVRPHETAIMATASSSSSSASEATSETASGRAALVPSIWAPSGRASDPPPTPGALAFVAEAAGGIVGELEPRFGRMLFANPLCPGKKFFSLAEAERASAPIYSPIKHKGAFRV